MELDATFSTGLNELPALVGNEGALETAMIEIKRKYISALMTKCEVKTAGYWSVKNSMATFVLKIPPIPTTFLGDLMRLILKENSLKFNYKHSLQTLA